MLYFIGLHFVILDLAIVGVVIKTYLKQRKVKKFLTECGKEK